MSPKQTEVTAGVEALLRQREARGLLASAVARAAFLLVGAAISLPNSRSAIDTVTTLVLAAIGLGVCAHGVRVCRRERLELAALLRVGRVGALFDAVVLTVLPLIWYVSVGGSSVNPAFLLRNDVVVIVLVLMVINTLSLRPAYPWLIALVGVALQVGYGIYALPDPRVELTSGIVDTILGSKINLGFYLWSIVATVLCGYFLTRLCWWGRRTLREVAELEHATQRIMEQQAQALLEAKTGALARLVAGIAHELNTPLGALISASETAASSGSRLREATASGGAAAGETAGVRRKTERLLAVLDSSGETARQAGERMRTLVASLTSFARLDATDREAVDLAAALERAVEMVDKRRRAGVALALELTPLPPLEVDVAAFNQVFLTLLENAYEALDGAGTLTLRSAVADGRLELSVADDGPGIAKAAQAELFDLAFAAKQGRVGMGLGLPTAKRTIEAHGGALRVESAPGAGARFVISLPAPVASAGAMKR